MDSPKEKGKALIRSICQLLWFKYSQHVDVKLPTLHHSSRNWEELDDVQTHIII